MAVVSKSWHANLSSGKNGWSPAAGSPAPAHGTERVIEDLFRLLARPELPWLLSAAIAFGALLLWSAFRARLAPVLAALDQALAIVEETDGPAGFRNRFPTISRALADNPVLGEAWRAFAVTLEPAPEPKDALGYTRRPQEHFDDSLLLSTGFNMRFYQAVPNLLVGLGLLFTFVGLVAALHFASAGVRSADVAAAQAALGDLLAAATFKFATSIAGLGSSILFSWREKAQLHRAQARILRFCHALEARTVPLTAESIGVAQLVELRRHSGELQRLTRSGPDELVARVEERIEAKLHEAFAPLRAALATLASQLTQDPDWLVAAVRGEPASGVRRRAGPAAVEVAGRRDIGAALLHELREIRRGLAELAAALSRPAGATADEQAGMPGGDLQATVERTHGQLARIGEALRTVWRRLGSSGDTRLREELVPTLRDLHARLQEGAQAVRRLRAALAAGGGGLAASGELVALARLEAELEETGRQLDRLTGRVMQRAVRAGEGGH